MLKSIEENYRASLLLSAAADALGYRNGRWRSLTNAAEIQRELENEFEQIESISIEPPNWSVSDNTILHLAVARALIEDENNENLSSRVVKHLKLVENDLKTRHPNSTIISAIDRLTVTDRVLPYSSVSFDCSAAVRSMSIGLRYPHPSDWRQLFDISIEISRLTHTHLEGYLSGFLSALFTSYAVQGKDVHQWILSMLKLLPEIRQRIENEKNIDVNRTMRNWSSFEHFWNEFSHRQQTNIDDLKTRDEFYREFSRTAFPAAGGNDSIAIALNALINCKGSWTNLCQRASLHAGRSDASGTIAGAFFGLVYGFDRIPKRNYENVEFHDELLKISQHLFEMSHRTSQRGAAVHFQFVPSDILDKMLKFSAY